MYTHAQLVDKFTGMNKKNNKSPSTHTLAAAYGIVTWDYHEHSALWHVHLFFGHEVSSFSLDPSQWRAIFIKAVSHPQTPTRSALIPPAVTSARLMIFPTFGNIRRGVVGYATRPSPRPFDYYRGSFLKFTTRS